MYRHAPINGTEYLDSLIRELNHICHHIEWHAPEIFELGDECSEDEYLQQHHPFFDLHPRDILIDAQDGDWDNIINECKPFFAPTGWSEFGRTMLALDPMGHDKVVDYFHYVLSELAHEAKRLNLDSLSGAFCDCGRCGACIGDE